MSEKFTVVIPLYNKEKTIIRAISSVLAQTYKNYEIIVVDDGSTDSSCNFLSRLNDPRIKIIKQRNMGVSIARNRGIQESSSDLIAFLDADDEWLPRHLERIADMNQKYPNAGAYTTSYLMVSPGGKVTQPKYCNIPPAPFEGPIPNYFKTLLYGDPPICSSTACVRKRIFFEVGFFPQGEPFGEDLDMWGRIALKYDIIFDWTVGALWYLSDGKPLYTHVEPFVITARNSIQNLKVKNEFLIYIEKYIEKKTIECATNNISSGYFLEARKILTSLKFKYYRKEKLFWLFITIIPQRFLPLMKKIKNRLFNNDLKRKNN
ncbi:MAG TPA: glycosyltransferase family A protein [Victivallales bacterium]|nr:glycosyltransferase family A protein [Victivallales bacterium]